MTYALRRRFRLAFSNRKAVVKDHLSFIAVATALTAAVFNHTAKLRKVSKANVDRATACGFFIGLFVSLAVVFVDLT